MILREERQEKPAFPAKVGGVGWGFRKAGQEKQASLPRSGAGQEFSKDG